MEKKKRTGMLETAAALKNKTAAGAAAGAPALNVDYTVSGINLRRSDWKLLRQVADARGDLYGGRRSVSKVIESLIEANRKALETERAQAARVA